MEKENTQQNEQDSELIARSNRFLVSFPKEIGLQSHFINDCSIGDITSDEINITLTFCVNKEVISKAMALSNLKFAMKVEMLDNLGKVIFTYFFDDCVTDGIYPSYLSYTDDENHKIIVRIKAKTFKLQ